MLQPRKSLTIGKEMLEDCCDEITLAVIFEYPLPLFDKIFSRISDFEMHFFGLCDFNLSVLSINIDGAGNAVISN